MAIQMTRAEYEAKYGTKAPVATSSTPIQMTRAEYDAKYGKPTQPVVKKPTIADDFRSRTEKGADVIQKGLEGERSNLEVGLGLVGQGAGFIGDLAGRAISAVTPDPIGELALKPVRAVAQSSFGQAVSKRYKALPERARENIEAVGNVASILPIGKGAQLTKQGIDKTIDVTGKVLAPSVKTVEKNIVRDFEKAVKPLLPSRATPATAQKYKDEIVNAVKIINNNPELSFVDEIGEKVIGKKPASLQELSEAVDQTKKSVYKQYNDLAKQAGESGVKINTNSIAGELDNVIKNEALQISNPEAVKYAFDLKERLKFRDLDAETTQSVIQNYNKSLEAFYRNPTYDNASKASIDALIVNQLRQKLDDAVTNVTGSQYQPLKNMYSSLKTVERDVIKAALRDARKNNKGLIDFTDIFTGGDIITGILTLNPSQLARGAFSRGIKEFYSYLNSPNRAIKNVFKNAEKLNQRLPKSQSTPSNMSSAAPSGNSLLQSQPAKSIPTTPNINAIPQSLQQPAKSSNKLSTPKGLLNTAIENLKNPSKRQGGYIRNPLAKKELPVSKSSSVNNTTDLVSEAKKYKSAEEFIQAKNPIPDNGFIGRKQAEEWAAKTDELRKAFEGKPFYTPDQLKTGIEKLPKEIEYNGEKYVRGSIGQVTDATTGKLKRVSLELISPKLGVKDITLTGDELLDFYNKAQGKSLSNDLIEASVSSKLPPQRVPVTKPNFTPEIKNNIADIIDLLRGKRVSKIREEELMSDMAAIIEDFGFGIPRTTAGKVKLLDLIYNGAI